MPLLQSASSPDPHPQWMRVWGGGGVPSSELFKFVPGMVHVTSISCCILYTDGEEISFDVGMANIKVALQIEVGLSIPAPHFRHWCHSHSDAF